jgi:hypothetical protein
VGHTSIKTPAADSRSVRHVALTTIQPSPENDALYRPISDDDPATVALADSVRQHGILEPLVASRDGFIISGHRRYAAARLAGLSRIPVRFISVRRGRHIDRFTALLREHNRQRVKSLDELLREEVVSADPEVAHANLLAHRQPRKRDMSQNGRIDLGERRERSSITPAKEPMLLAIENALDDRSDFWPLSVRALHYALLNEPPLRHASKPNSRYRNDDASYKSLCDLLTRARHEGRISWDAIDDPTRPIILGDPHSDVQSFVHRDLDYLFLGYRRDLQRSQPDHIEIVGEKLTIRSIIEPVAKQYTIPLTIGKGFSSTPPRKRMAERFHASGKARLVLLFLCDFDPDGDGIAGSFARSMRDDFGVGSIAATKVALRVDQIERYAMADNPMEAKRTSSRWPIFAARYGEDQPVYELESVRPADLQTFLREAIDRAMDLTLFNREIDAERADAAFLDTARRRAMKALEGACLNEAGR